MLIAPHQVALHTDRLEAVAPIHRTNGTRWTWIAGRRYRGIRRL